MRSSHFAIILALVTLVILVPVPAGHSTSSNPQNNRLFYLDPPRSLSTTVPLSSQNYTFKGAPVSFLYGSVQGPLTVSGPITFSLWFNFASTNTSATANVEGSFDYRFPSLNWNNASQASSTISPGRTEVNATYNIGAGTPITISTQLAIEINVTSIPKNSNVTLEFGARPMLSQIPSRVGLVLSGYASMPQISPVLVLDKSGTPTTDFNVNFVPGNNIVLIEASASSSFGLSDISLNLTISDPNGKPVPSATNKTMTSGSLATNPQPYTFFATWLYFTNSTQGTYLVRIEVIDSQNNVAFVFGGVASFALVPPGYVPFPYNLLPYLTIGAVAISGGVGGAIVYRRRRSRSYLVPFDYFYNLTGGELSGGTIVTVEGNTGSGKTILLEQLMGDDLRRGRSCVFVATGDFPDTVRSNMKSMGIDVTGYEQRGLLTFVDGYSAEAGQESKEKFSIPSLSDLTTLGIKLTSAFPAPSFKGGSLYFDSLTPLASKARSDSIVSLVQSVGAKVKGLDGKAFFAIGSGIDTSVQRQLEDTTDCIVQMEAFEEAGTRRRRLRISKFRARKHQESWALFTIEEGKGIIFYSRRPRQ